MTSAIHTAAHTLWGILGFKFKGSKGDTVTNLCPLSANSGRLLPHCHSVSCGVELFFFSLCLVLESRGTLPRRVRLQSISDAWLTQSGHWAMIVTKKGEVKTERVCQHGGYDRKQSQPLDTISALLSCHGEPRADTTAHTQILVHLQGTWASAR